MPKFLINATEKTWYESLEVEAKDKEAAEDIYNRMLEDGQVLVTDVTNLTLETIQL